MKEEESMKSMRMISVCLLICTLFAFMGCAPEPKVRILQAANDTVVTVFSIPAPLDIEINVPAPPLFGNAAPIDPASLTATLQRLEAGEPVGAPISIDVHDEAVFEHIDEEGNHTWTGTQEIVDIGEYELTVTALNSSGSTDKPAVAVSVFQVEVNAAAFPGGTYDMLLSVIIQEPNGCLLTDPFRILLNTVRLLINKDLRDNPGSGYLTIPSGQDILAAPDGYGMSIPLPMIGFMDVNLSIDTEENLILLDGPDEFVIDMSSLSLPLEGFECIVVMGVNGVVDNLDPKGPEGQVFFDVLDVLSMGDCELKAPVNDCDLTVGLMSTLVEEE